MFTGIIEEVGTVEAVEASGNGRDIVIAARSVLSDLDVGDSISVDGVCQTVVERTSAAFRVHAIATTLSRTTLGEFEMGRRVNLERPVTAGGRFGGHLVQGHVDGVGEVVSVDEEGEMVRVRFTLPDTVGSYTILHGSIALDGVSLTVNDLSPEGNAEVALIPYTYANTNLARLVRGSRVNLEADLLGKYAVRALSGYREGAGDSPSSGGGST